MWETRRSTRSVKAGRSGKMPLDSHMNAHAEASVVKEISRNNCFRFLIFFFQVLVLSGCLTKWAIGCVRAQVPHWLVPSAREVTSADCFPASLGRWLHMALVGFKPRPCQRASPLHPQAFIQTLMDWGQKRNENDTVWPCTKSTYIRNANMLMLTFSLLPWGLVVQTCDGGREVNDEIMHSGNVYVSVLERRPFPFPSLTRRFLVHYSSAVILAASPHFQFVLLARWYIITRLKTSASLI